MKSTSPTENLLSICSLPNFSCINAILLLKYLNSSCPRDSSKLLSTKTLKYNYFLNN